MPLKNSSDDRAIARGMLTVTFLVLLGSIARAGREVAIAYRYGVSVEVDAYLFVFNLVNWPLAVWFAILTVVVVPLAARIRQNAPTELPMFRSELLGLSIAIGVVFTAASLWLVPVVLRAPQVGLSHQLIEAALTTVTPLAMIAPFGILVGLFSVWTMAAGKHANTLLEGVPSLCILIAIVALPIRSTLPLVAGTLAGFGLHAMALFLLLRRVGTVESPRLTMKSPHWQSFFKGFGIMLAGQILMSMTTLIDQFFAGQLGDGNIATLNYANRILALIMGVGALAVSRTTLPIFSKNQALESSQMPKLAKRWVWRLFAIGLAVVVLVWLTSPMIVNVFFERGAFSSKNSQAVVALLRVCLPQIPFYVSGIVLTSYFASCGAYRVLFLSSLLALFVKLFASYALINQWGLNGLPFSTCLMYAATFTLLLLMLHRQSISNSK